MPPKKKTARVTKRGVSVAEASAMMLALPGVAKGRSYGLPAFKVDDEFFARLRDDDTVLVVKLGSFTDRDYLMQSDPETFFTTDHYRDYPTVLIRLVRVARATLMQLLADAAGRSVAKSRPTTKPARRRSTDSH